jgi:hypothetical protein
MDKGWMDCCEQATAEANKRIAELEAKVEACDCDFIAELNEKLEAENAKLVSDLTYQQVISNLFQKQIFKMEAELARIKPAAQAVDKARDKLADGIPHGDHGAAYTEAVLECMRAHKALKKALEV